jgi:DNA (cytosine-5)-methyltransferase 1
MRTVDLFAGFGGFTTGAESAGAKVLWAANHWPVAVKVHAHNHPHVEHACQDLMQCDWTRLPRGIDLVLASPACQGHSRASQPKRGKQHEIMRMTAWAVIDCLEVTRPRSVLVENVPAFLKWPLFDTWKQAFDRLGYHVTVQVLDAAKCGVPQRRKRLIVSGNRKRAIEIKEPGTTEQPFAEHIDWNAGKWKPIAKAGPDARQRMVAAALFRGGRCLVQHVTGHRGIGLDEPIRTITTKMQWCLVDGDRYRFLTPREIARGMSFPDSYEIPDGIGATLAIKGFGNAIPPKMAEAAVRQVMEAS